MRSSRGGGGRLNDAPRSRMLLPRGDDTVSFIDRLTTCGGCQALCKSTSARPALRNCTVLASFFSRVNRSIFRNVDALPTLAPLSETYIDLSGGLQCSHFDAMRMWEAKQLLPASCSGGGLVLQRRLVDEARTLHAGEPVRRLKAIKSGRRAAVQMLALVEFFRANQRVLLLLKIMMPPPRLRPVRRFGPFCLVTENLFKYSKRCS